MEKCSFEDQDEDRVHDAHTKGYFSPVGSASPKLGMQVRKQR